MNSATLIQVMCGVLGGLYWALLPENQNKGLCFGEDVDYKTVLSITEKLLGKIYSNKTYLYKYTCHILFQKRLQQKQDVGHLTHS